MKMAILANLPVYLISSAAKVITGPVFIQSPFKDSLRGLEFCEAQTPGVS